MSKKEKIEWKQIYPEFPNLLMAHVGNSDVFNVDKFLEGSESNLTVEQYLEERERVVDLYSQATKIDKNFLVMKLEGEPTMMLACMAIDFACWVNPFLSIYISERAHELFIDGVTVSDRYLAIHSKRLPNQEK